MQYLNNLSLTVKGRLLRLTYGLKNILNRLPLKHLAIASCFSITLWMNFRFLELIVSRSFAIGWLIGFSIALASALMVHWIYSGYLRSCAQLLTTWTRRASTSCASPAPEVGSPPKPSEDEDLVVVGVDGDQPPLPFGAPCTAPSEQRERGAGPHTSLVRTMHK